MSVLSEALSQYYRLKGVTVRELAKEWDTSPTTVHRFLNGHGVDGRLLVRIFLALLK